MIILAAPSGAGKSSFVERICREDERLVDTITYTTREMRKGEAQGHPYYFVSKEEFEQKQIDIMSDSSDESSIDSNDPVRKVDTDVNMEEEQPMINIASEAHSHVPFGSMLINRRTFNIPKIKHKHKKSDAFF